jgi:hypothetical protein
VIGGRFLAAAHIIIAIVLLPFTIFPLPLAPILASGPIWAIVLGVRMWRRRDVIRALRRTHYVFLGIDALLIWYGVYMLRAAEASAARGGGLMGGLGIIPIAFGICLALFSLSVLLWIAVMAHHASKG